MPTPELHWEQKVVEEAWLSEDRQSLMIVWADGSETTVSVPPFDDWAYRERQLVIEDSDG